MNKNGSAALYHRESKMIGLWRGPALDEPKYSRVARLLQSILLLNYRLGRLTYTYTR